MFVNTFVSVHMYVYFQFVAVILFVGHLEWCKDFGCPVFRSFCGSCPRLEVLLEVLFFDIIINSQGLVSKCFFSLEGAKFKYWLCFIFVFSWLLHFRYFHKNNSISVYNLVPFIQN